MRKYLSKTILCILAIAPTITQAATISADIVGNTIRWNNANLTNGQVSQMIWQSSSKHNLQKVKEWSPVLSRSSQDTIEFRATNADNNHTISVPVTHTGIELKGNSQFSQSPSSTLVGTYGVCTHSTGSNGYALLIDDAESLCGANFGFLADDKYRPFDFYRSGFRFADAGDAGSNSLIESFKGAPAGVYHGSINIPISYLVKFGDTHSYRTFNDTVNFVVRYKPSFLSSVDIIGDGKFILDYDTNEHSVRGTTKFNVNVTGYLSSGLLMSFKSTGADDKDFSLENGTSRIPYDLVCNMCEKPDVITDGMLNTPSEPSKIPFVGKRLNFNLKFFFDDVHYGEIEEGTFKDSVVVMFQPDL